MANVVGPEDGKAGFVGTIGVRFIISGGGFSLPEHPMSPRALAAPLHRHNGEDEYSFILEGRVGRSPRRRGAGRRPGGPDLQDPRRLFSQACEGLPNSRAGISAPFQAPLDLNFTPSVSHR
jgi:hypothetical protein